MRFWSARTEEKKQQYFVVKFDEDKINWAIETAKHKARHTNNANQNGDRRTQEEKIGNQLQGILGEMAIQELFERCGLKVERFDEIRKDYFPTKSEFDLRITNAEGKSYTIESRSSKLKNNMNMDYQPIIGKYVNPVKKPEKDADLYIKTLVPVKEEGVSFIDNVKMNPVVYITGIATLEQMNTKSQVQAFGQSKALYQILPITATTQPYNFLKLFGAKENMDLDWRKKEELNMTYKEQYDNIIIDASSLLHYIFHSEQTNNDNVLLRSLTGEDEQVDVHALRSYVLYCSKLQEQFPNARIIHACDSSDSSEVFRKQIYPEYKANRKEKDPRLEKQVNMLPKLLCYLNAEVYQNNTFEGDDIIATVVNKTEGKNLIFSRDKDLLQLISERTHCLSSRKLNEHGEYVDLVKTSEQVKEKYGVLPEHIPTYLAFVGDSADNIKGVKGVGPKTAQILIGDKGIGYWLNNPDEFPKQKKYDTAEVVDELIANLTITELKRDVELKEPFELKTTREQNVKIMQNLLLLPVEKIKGMEKRGSFLTLEKDLDQVIKEQMTESIKYSKKI